MTEREQIEALAEDLDKLISRYCEEFDLTTASAVGVLSFKIHTLMADAVERHKEGEE